LVDRAGLKGVARAGARVSPTHANFVITDGSATAADIKALIEECRSAVKDRFGVTLQDEIICLGF
jgi:UDP-N-acetylmuramate dehydrogenase